VTHHAIFKHFLVNLCDMQRLFSHQGLKCASAWVLCVPVLLLSSQDGPKNNNGGECQQPHSRLHSSFSCILSHTPKKYTEKRAGVKPEN